MESTLLKKLIEFGVLGLLAGIFIFLYLRLLKEYRALQSESIKTVERLKDENIESLKETLPLLQSVQSSLHKLLDRLDMESK